MLHYSKYCKNFFLKKTELMKLLYILMSCECQIVICNLSIFCWGMERKSWFLLKLTHKEYCFKSSLAWLLGTVIFMVCQVQFFKICVFLSFGWSFLDIDLKANPIFGYCSLMFIWCFCQLLVHLFMLSMHRESSSSTRTWLSFSLRFNFLYCVRT